MIRKSSIPCDFAATHGFTEIHPWPVDQDGVDYSVVRNHTKGPVSMFSYGSRENFMGVWNPHTDTGTVHFADYEEVPARKIWSWGVDADGLDWRKALSDDNSGYVEVQAGLFRNQETYAFLRAAPGTPLFGVLDAGTGNRRNFARQPFWCGQP